MPSLIHMNHTEGYIFFGWDSVARTSESHVFKESSAKISILVQSPLYWLSDMLATYFW